MVLGALDWPGARRLKFAGKFYYFTLVIKQDA